MWTGNFGVVSILGQRRNALAHGHRLAPGLISGVHVVLEMSSAEWNRIGWLVRVLLAAAPSILAQWPYNANGNLVLPGPMDDWEQGVGAVRGLYRAVHSCYQSLAPPEAFILFTDDSGQSPPDNSVNDLLGRGSPAIFIPKVCGRDTKLLKKTWLCCNQRHGDNTLVHGHMLVFMYPWNSDKDVMQACLQKHQEFLESLLDRPVEVDFVEELQCGRSLLLVYVLESCPASTKHFLKAVIDAGFMFI